MAVPQYHNGADGLAKAGANQLAVTKWDLTVLSNNKDVSNSKDGRKRIPGVPDANGSLDLHWDSANEPTATGGPNIRSGSILTITLIVDGLTNGWQMSAIVDEVKTSSDFEGTIDFSVKFSLATGSSLVYPS